ncbi:hypothetical protein J27TS8_40910 [Robertmurraya siralis]|uniref:SLH domain-containing protein n=1 Tax=Robertmurraya siralis TaxID=77777 RepID=A0A920BVM8_9BACI|nr:DUF4855 domain-containing protein [Robertmurraya siralis]GIN64098.1 hypothetical protein J27TS8_40910 [Robertmurraya siralis]
MKKSIIFIALFLFVFLNPQTSYGAIKFKDVSTGYWAYNEIQYLTSQGIIKGFSDQTFKPGANITKQEAAIMMNRALNLSLEKLPANRFKDVNSKLAGYREILSTVDKGLFGGTAFFYPHKPLTRGEMAKSIVVGYQLTGTSNKSFSDVSKSNPYYQYINVLVANNITTGFKDGTFKPNQPITRAEFSSFIYRVSNKPIEYLAMIDNKQVAQFTSREKAIEYAMNRPGTAIIPRSNNKELYPSEFLSSKDVGIESGVLIYNGYETDAKLAKNGKYPEHFFDGYVSYQKDGQYIDKFFDTFIILGLRYPEGNFQQSYALNRSDYKDWDWYLDRTFDPEGVIARLSESVQADPNIDSVNVYMAIPYPKNHFTFTTLDGKTYDVTENSRLDIVKWYVEETAKRIQSGNYPGINLEGFYWLNETINLKEDEALLKRVSSYLKNSNYKFTYSPHAGTANLPNWKSYGFDAPYLQSNAFKIRTNHDAMLKKLHDGYIRSILHGTGVNIEIENSGPKDIEVSFRNLRAYLELGRLYDLSGKSIIMYQGTEMIYRLTAIQEEEYREMYDELYEFLRDMRK